MAKIPIYQVRLPEYKIKRIKKSSRKTKYAITPVYNIKIPSNYERFKPDFAKLGAKIDRCLKNHFLGQKVAIRALSSQEHRGKSVHRVVEIIKKLGHDRYDPSRRGDRYENLERKHIDFFAIPFKIRKRGEYARQFLEPFYYWPIHDRGYPVRVDILIVYDPKQLRVVEHRYKGRENEIKRDGFVFKHHDKKPEAIKGIVKIL